MARNRLRFALKNVDIDLLPRFVIHYTLDTVRALARGLRDRRPGHAWLLARALAWNLGQLPATVPARRRDAARSGPGARSYNRSLPLRDRASDGQGGLRPAAPH
jgi:hypothetical protein